MAAGKVYSCPFDEKNALHGKYMLEKQYERENDIFYRVLSDETYNLPILEPTLEDGYMYLMQ